MNKGAKRPITLEEVRTMTKRSTTFLRKSSIFTLDVLVVLVGIIIAAPFALVLVSPFVASF